MATRSGRSNHWRPAQAARGIIFGKARLGREFLRGGLPQENNPLPNVTNPMEDGTPSEDWRGSRLNVSNLDSQCRLEGR